MQPIETSLNLWLVAVSIAISIVASYAAFSFADRVASSTGQVRNLWLGGGALAMGLGIWSMHYLGMLAVRLPFPVFYHLPTVTLSLALAVLASAVALFVVGRPTLGVRENAIGSLLMGAGIGGMHYTGMHAMRCEAMHRYRPSLVLLSIVVALVFSWTALQIASRARTNSHEILRLGGVTLMGSGIAAMHYTAMSAVAFLPVPMSFSGDWTVQIHTLGVFAVATTTAIVLAGALIAALVDRSFYDILSKERDTFRAVADCCLDRLYLCEARRDSNGDIQDFIWTYFNSNVTRESNLPHRATIGGGMRALMPKDDPVDLFALYKLVVATGEPLVTELSILDNDSKPAWLNIHAVKLRDGLAITAADITARKRDEEHIRYLAHHDPLTGLVNRSLLKDRIEQAIERANRNGGTVGVFLIDLDSFKQINDTLGHAAGDAVLVSVATRLTSAVRAMDSVVRIGGDEFVVIMPEIRDWSDLEQCASKFIDAFRPPLWIDGKSIAVTGSVGVAFYPDSGTTAAQLVSEADGAMYAAKRRGKNQFHIMPPAVDLESLSRIVLQ